MYDDIDWSSFDVEGSEDKAVAIAGLCASFYFAKRVDELAIEAANAIEQYIAYVGAKALTVYLAPSGLWKNLNSRQLSKDLQILRNFPADHEAKHINYDSADAPGPFGVSLAATRLSQRFEKNRANLLRFDFPPAWLTKHPPDELIGFLTSLLESMPVQSANIGLAFKCTEASKEEALDGVHSKLPRYLGFDPCYSDVRDDMRDHTFTAHWLNYVDQKLAAKLGGLKHIIASLPECEVSKLSGGVLIRGAKLPPIGDANRGAKDLGCLPDVARVLGPVRCRIDGFGEPDFDSLKWLARLDKLPSRKWDNSCVS